MKRLGTILTFSFVSTFYFSCTEEVATIIDSDDNNVVVFSAEADETIPTRANFQDLSGESAAFKWEIDDEVGVYASGYTTLYTLKATIVDGNQATLVGTNIPSTTHYLGVYPKSAVKSQGGADNIVNIAYPAIQTIPVTSSENKQYVDPAAFIQIGYTSGNYFQMKTPCSFLKFHTGDNCNFDWVKITAYGPNDEVYGIVGNMTVTAKEDNSEFSLSTNPSPDNIVTCKYAGGTFPSNCDFAIAIRPGEYGKIVLTTSTGIQKTATKMKTKTGLEIPLNFATATYYPMGTL